MRDFPSCFGENGIQIIDSSSSSTTTSKAAQNLVTCIYQSTLQGMSCLINITWSKNLMGQVLSVGIDDSTTHHCLCKVDIKPWLFSKRKGCKTLELANKKSKVDIYWDLSLAKFGSGPEPLEGFYVAIVFDKEMVLLLGNLTNEAYKKANLEPNSSFNGIVIAKREHIFGKKVYCTKAQFFDNGLIHDLIIECDTVGLREPCLVIQVDSKTVMQVKRLRWKFRGNQTILVDGFHVEVFWDVHSWLFGAVGNAVFMFQTCLAAEKSWATNNTSTDSSFKRNTSSDSSATPWSCSETFRESQLQGLGFSLVLYAWKHE
ncbi:hypothetical protein MKW98_003518 [Papaver atlanticum]|uniref:DUF868 domain-containing protein n=1 Tax=Papaver atlanticum TaxID=357466 RepID=A0AAD4TBM6_9MAGN|nr:hypothetical protein MKW98_003518 [Papaver atlanticum]